MSSVGTIHLCVAHYRLPHFLIVSSAMLKLLFLCGQPHAWLSLYCYHVIMPDNTGPVATERDDAYSLSIEETSDIYVKAGHPRTLRTIQRYCANGHLDCLKAATSLGDKYFVSPQSVSRHLAQIEELREFENRRTERGVSRPDTSLKSSVFAGDQQRQAPSQETVVSPTVANQPSETNEPDSSRPDAAGASVVSPDVARLEGDNERLREDITFLRDQIKTKDTQIEALLERDHETNVLVRGLQEMLAPLLGAPSRSRDGNQGHQNYSEDVRRVDN